MRFSLLLLSMFLFFTGCNNNEKKVEQANSDHAFQ